MSALTSDLQDAFVLVTPVYNDVRRLTAFGTELAQALASWDENIIWIIADDGSIPAQRAATGDVVQDFGDVYARSEMLKLPGHAGKGGTIISAWKKYREARWLGFVDADGSISPAAVRQLYERARSEPQAGAILGVRDLQSGTATWHNPVRRHAHWVFARLAAATLGLRVRDTQCGSKILSGEAFRTIEPVLREKDFIFDCELLAALKVNGFEILEQPVPWIEQPGGQVMIQRDAWAMFKGLQRVKRRMRAGELRVAR